MTDQTATPENFQYSSFMVNLRTNTFQKTATRVAEDFLESISDKRTSIVENSEGTVDTGKPAWLSDIVQILRNSPYSLAEHGLSREAADAAIKFFYDTADLLPCKPYIHSSQLGDLVSEYKMDRGTLTIIISTEFIILFAVVDGIPTEFKIDKNAIIRDELNNFITSLLA